MTELTKWSKFLKELGNLLFFWFLGILFFTLYRLTFISIFSKEWVTPFELPDFSRVLFMGFRFDCTAMGYFLFLPFLALLLLSYFNKFDWIKKIRITMQYLFVVLSVIICIITLNYYSEYNEQFNNFVFLGIYDDQAAIAKTIMEYYNPWMNLGIGVGLCVFWILMFRFFENKTKLYRMLSHIKPGIQGGLLITICIFLFVCNIRGTFTRVPAIRKWAAVSKDPFLNKTIINPYRSLKYAWHDFHKLNLKGDNPFGEEDLSLVFGKELVPEVLEKQAQGAQIEKPKQIFIVIMESYDSWPLMDKYLSFGVSGRLHEIASQGIHFDHFLPSYNATIYGYMSTVTGIPYCGVNLAYLGGLHDPYITSAFNQFKKLGYTTNFFYGGFLSWENIGEFTRYQGCDHLYSGVDAGGKSDSGEWGVEDEKLFDMVLERVDPDEYSFNVILTSSYHAPYVVDIYKKGFPYRSVEDFPKQAQACYKNGMKMIEFGHLWYGDQEIGRFVDSAKAKFPQSLYSFTGDHYGRRFLTPTPNLYEKSSVPFIIYGNGVPAMKKNTPGDHTDIIPTLIELVAPEGFTYYSFGSSLLNGEKKCGIGFEKMITDKNLFYAPKDAPVICYDMVNEDTHSVDNLPEPDLYKKRMMLAWHYVMRGNSLKVRDSND